MTAERPHGDWCRCSRCNLATVDRVTAALCDDLDPTDPQTAPPRYAVTADGGE